MKYLKVIIIVFTLVSIVFGVQIYALEAPTPPVDPVKLIFIHHNCGENWLEDGNGGLGLALESNNYYVSDTNYG